MRPRPSDPTPQQHAEEWRWLLGQIAGSASILEIGSCYGQSLRDMAYVALSGAKIRSVDLGQDGGKIDGLRAALDQRIADLNASGYDAAVMYGDSKSPECIEWARKAGPYDFVFIDGDHSYEGVKADWENYGPMGKLVGFHDIRWGTVTKLWDEVKAVEPNTAEIVKSKMGIGLVYR